jgi:hypothetical protein
MGKEITMSTRRLFTIPYLCVRLQRPIGLLESAITVLKITPQLQLNDTPYFDAAQEEQIDQYLRERQIRQIRERPQPR